VNQRVHCLKMKIYKYHLSYYCLTLTTMSCYICLESDGQLLSAGSCKCKGSNAVHKECLNEWLKTADNPFQCTVCKADYPGTFLNKFLSAEDILFHPTGDLEEDEEGEFVVRDFHGIPILQEENGDIAFFTEEHRTIYLQTVRKEYKSLKMESRHRQKQTARTQNKHNHSNRGMIRRK